MAFQALIAVPLSAERPGGPWAGAGPVAPVPPQTRHRTGVHHTNPSASGTRVSMALRPRLPRRLAQSRALTSEPVPSDGTRSGVAQSAEHPAVNRRVESSSLSPRAETVGNQWIS